MHSKNRTNPFLNRQPLQTGGREVFLQRVRTAHNHGTQTPPPTEPPPTRDEAFYRQTPATLSPEELRTRWLAKAKTNTMTIQETTADPTSVHAALDACLAQHTITKSILNARDLTAQLQLPQYLARKNIQALDWGSPNCREEAFHCEASITDCRAGLADSGSLLVWSDQTFGRSTTLVIPVHIILLPASRILPDMIDALQFARDKTTSPSSPLLPSNIVIINGPSKTADIEMNLVTGVHGPKFLYVILIQRL